MPTIPDYKIPQVMGILNVTPDSFSDGGQFITPAQALLQARCLYEEGATIIDIGGESTRPNAVPVDPQAELERVMPVVEAVKAEVPVAISLDTSKAVVMREAIAAGVFMINDVAALRYDGSLEAVAASDTVQVCLMHMQGTPRTMQNDPQYIDVVSEVRDFLLSRAQACQAAGIAADRIVIDPGFGFGKTPAHNLQLMKQLSVLVETDFPVLIGVSRKSLLGAVLKRSLDQRLYGSLALAVLAVQQGARIVRTHDVAATVDALRITQAVLEAV